MTKDDLIVDVQKATAKMGLSKAAVKEVVDCTFDVLAKAIKKDKRFQVPGFGVFVVRSRKGRTGRNPQTGEVIKIKPSKTVAFKPSPQLKKGL
jgi:DNA-binding protein HU-beta